MESHFLGGRSGLVVRSRFWGRRVPGSQPDSTDDPPYMRPVARQIIRSGQPPSRWCDVEGWRGEGTAQTSSSSSHRGSKLRVPSQNSPRVSTKRDVNITKTKKTHFLGVIPLTANFTCILNDGAAS
ncbi:hypothetical protein AVEN_275133-1 [Araneus ventricosus]|uniref:Uncharacterized protein n=1 Tax=Araneus ventricosus TaxID=182803 RepID=A0A4Y2G3Q0_ARAVE|nr:hypothetical protein AVEN_275133-1 [Araneus ventricosus]